MVTYNIITGYQQQNKKNNTMWFIDQMELA